MFDLGPRLLSSRKAATVSGLAFVLVAGVVTAIGANAHAAGVTNVTVNFNEVVAATPASHIGISESEFGTDGGPVAKSQGDINSLKALDAGAVRLQLTMNGNTAVSGAGGGDRSVTGAQWMNVYVNQLHVQPTVIVNLDVNDATAVLRYLRANGYNVERFIVGNEMDANSKSNVSETQYENTFHQIAAAFRAIDPNIQIGGPASACFPGCGIDQGMVQNLLSGAANASASFIDFHAYGAGQGAQAAMVSSYQPYVNDFNTLKGWIGGSQDAGAGMEVGEYNMNWAAEPGDNTQKQTVWMAAATGTIISQGGTAFEYSTKNTEMGLTAGGGAPKASYWGMAMFTGAGKFRHFGTSEVATTSSDQGVRVFASNNGDNIVLVNTNGGATTASIKMTGAPAGAIQEWQSINMAPVQKGAPESNNGLLPVDLPGMSVTTLVLNGGGTGGGTTSTTAPKPATTTTTTQKAVTTTTAPKPVTTTTPAPAPTTTVAVSPGGAGPLTVVQPMNVSGNAVNRGGTLIGSAMLKNSTSTPVTVLAVVLAGRPPNGTNAHGPFMDFGPSPSRVVLQPGESIFVTELRTFGQDDPTGQWRGYVTYETADGAWHDDTTNANFAVI